MPVSFDDLEMAYALVSASAGLGESVAYVARETGLIYTQSDITGIDELPDDVEDEEKYIKLPDKYELHLGKPLAIDFARRFLAGGDVDEVYEIFRRKGAYGRFKAFLTSRNALQKWYDYEAEAEKQALRDWCALHELELVD